MKIAGIIAEYNPFHNGHAHHIAETRRITGCDYVVVCMTGSMTQRGELALLSRRERVNAALRNGADAVFELPAFFAVRTADVFARAGVHILSSLGCDLLSFGCEDTDIGLLRQIADARDSLSTDARKDLQSGLAAGRSHARAWGDAVAMQLGIDPAYLNAPNLILGTEYIRSIRALHSPMTPIAVQRCGTYSDPALPSSGFASAAAIRSDPTAAGVDHFVPQETLSALNAGIFPHEPDDLLLYRLRGMTAEAIAALPDVREGLENRILECARRASSRSELIAAVKCKRYTYARISRLCAHALLGLDRDTAARHPLPEYIRLTGFRSDASPLLHELKRRTNMPIVTRSAALIGNEIFHYECLATDLRALCMNRPELRGAGTELTEKFTVI